MKAKILMTALSLAFAASAQADPLALQDAEAVLEAAVAEAHRLKAPGAAVAVVDEGGNLVASRRLDDTFAAGSRISIGKARTAALFKKPTAAFEDLINNGRTAMAALPDFTPLKGGVPVMKAGRIVGAVGVSGAASAQQDVDIAVVASKALEQANIAELSYFDAAATRALFERGGAFVETPDYKVHASRRTGPGQVEVHAHETDVVYVLHGSASFVTGGTPVDPRVTAPGEIRADSVVGGTTRTLHPGDVVVVPKGTAHWFKEIHAAPFHYFVVKPIH